MNDLLTIPAKYYMNGDMEIATIPGIVYQEDGKKKIGTFTWSPNSSVILSIQLAQNLIFYVRHVFVGRYIDEVVKQPQDQVEVFRIYLSRGDFPERPTDLLGELVTHFEDPEGNHVWFSYEHISGPYLLDPMLVVSDMTSGQSMKEFAVDAPKDLIPNRRIYLNNPSEVKQLGIVNGDSEVEVDQKYLEDLLIRHRGQKKIWIN